MNASAACKAYISTDPRLTSMSLTKGSALSPTVLKHKPKKSEKVITPKMFMLTAAAATLSGNMLRATSSRASSGVRWAAAGSSVVVGAAACVQMAHTYSIGYYFEANNSA